MMTEFQAAIDKVLIRAAERRVPTLSPLIRRLLEEGMPSNKIPRSYHGFVRPTTPWEFPQRQAAPGEFRGAIEAIIREWESER
jgi:hypothetical protein